MRAEFNILEDELESAKGYVSFCEFNEIMDSVSYFTNADDLTNAVLDGKTIKVFWVDLNLGSGDEEEGIRMIRFIRPRYPSSLIVVYTAYSDTRQKCIDAGADHFFVKGGEFELTMKKIRDAIKEFLSLKGINVDVFTFDAQVAHIHERWVKLECFKDSLVTERLFPRGLIESAFKIGKLRIDAYVRIRVIQKNSAINLTVEELVEVDDEDDYDLPQSLIKSDIWNTNLDI